MLRSFGSRSLTTRSPMRISPSEGDSRPAMHRRVVVFPQPEGPRRTTNSLSWTSKSRFSTATVPSNSFRRPRISTLAMAWRQSPASVIEFHGRPVARADHRDAERRHDRRWRNPTADVIVNLLPHPSDLRSRDRGRALILFDGHLETMTWISVWDQAFLSVHGLPE